MKPMAQPSPERERRRSAMYSRLKLATSATVKPSRTERTNSSCKAFSAAATFLGATSTFIDRLPLCSYELAPKLAPAL